MKTLYSSSFISVILGFFVLFQSSGQTLEMMETDEKIHFSNIYEDQDIRKGEQTLAVEVFQKFDCPECQRFAKDVLPPLKSDYLDQQKAQVKIYTVSNPEIESETEPAKALHCAELQEKFWETQAAFAQHDGPLESADIQEIIQSMEIDIAIFDQCMNSEETLTALQEARIMAGERNITFYPTTLINSQRLTHYQPWENVEKTLKEF